MEFQGAIFDIDGTLLDSMGVWSQVDVDFFNFIANHLLDVGNVLDYVFNKVL